MSSINANSNVAADYQRYENNNFNEKGQNNPLDQAHKQPNTTPPQDPYIQLAGPNILQVLMHAPLDLDPLSTLLSYAALPIDIDTKTKYPLIQKAAHAL